MTDRPDPLRAALAAGGAAYGVWCTGADPLAAEALAASGVDWVVVDAQHGSLDAADLPSLVQAIELGGAAPVVRVGANTPQQLMRALDLGAVGVVVPLVEDAAGAARAAGACRYPPAGERSYGPARPAGHRSRSDERPLCLPMVESAAGLAAVEEIAATPEVDGVFVGAVDLGLSLGLGITGAEVPEALEAALDEVVAVCERHAKIVGAVARDAAHARGLVARGVRLVTVAADRGLVAAGLARVLGDLHTPDPSGSHEEEARR